MNYEEALAKLLDMQVECAKQNHGTAQAMMHEVMDEWVRREAVAKQLADSLKKLLEMLAKEAPGTPLNNHRFDALGIQCRAALAAYENPSMVSDKQAKIDAVIKQLMDACQLHVDSDGNTEWARKQRSHRQNEAYDKALAALNAVKELNQ